MTTRDQQIANYLFGPEREPMTRDEYETHTGYEDICSDVREQTDAAAAFIERVQRMLEALETAAYSQPRNSTEYYQLAETVTDCRRLLTNAMEEILL